MRFVVCIDLTFRRIWEGTIVVLSLDLTRSATDPASMEAFLLVGALELLHVFRLINFFPVGQIRNRFLHWTYPRTVSLCADDCPGGY